MNELRFATRLVNTSTRRELNNSNKSQLFCYGSLAHHLLLTSRLIHTHKNKKKKKKITQVKDDPELTELELSEVNIRTNYFTVNGRKTTN